MFTKVWCECNRPSRTPSWCLSFCVLFISFGRASLAFSLQGKVSSLSSLFWDAALCLCACIENLSSNQYIFKFRNKFAYTLSITMTSLSQSFSNDWEKSTLKAIMITSSELQNNRQASHSNRKDKNFKARRVTVEINNWSTSHVQYTQTESIRLRYFDDSIRFARSRSAQPEVEIREKIIHEPSSFLNRDNKPTFTVSRTHNYEWIHHSLSYKYDLLQQHFQLTPHSPDGLYILTLAQIDFQHDDSIESKRS